MSSSTTQNNYKNLVDELNSALYGKSVQSSAKDDYIVSTNPVETVTNAIDDKVHSVETTLRENYQNRFIQLIYQDCFSPDEINTSIRFIGQLKEIYGNTIMTCWFTSMYNEYVCDSKILKGLLYTILYYSDCFGDLVELAAQAALSNSSREINELAIRILESQCNEKHYKILCSLKNFEPWLQNYIDKVKLDFKKELCLS